MKKNIIILQILAVTLLTTSCGSTNPPNFHKVKKVPVGSEITKETTTEVVFDQLYYDYEKNVEFTLFRSGDSYILCRDNDSEKPVDDKDEVGGVNANWTRVESQIPEEIKIKDFEFLHVKADLTLLNGGEAGFANAPVITKVYEQKAMTYDEAMEKHLIKNYDRSVEYFAGPKICESNGDTFIIVYCSYQNYRVYKNGKYMDTFTNAFAADGAMGLAEIDGTADYKKDNMYNLFVFKCGDTYLGYKDNKWTPMLNESYKNEIANLTLKDGEMACIMNANILIANGGKKTLKMQ